MGTSYQDRIRQGRPVKEFGVPPTAEEIRAWEHPEARRAYAKAAGVGSRSLRGSLRSYTVE